MPTKDFQSMTVGSILTFPYHCGSQCFISSVNPIGTGMTGGSIEQSGNGFVGLAAGTKLEIQFPFYATAVAFQLWCGARPTRLEVYSSTGVHLVTRSLVKGPLGNGVIAFAAADIARAVLHHDNNEGLLLGLQWEGAQDDAVTFGAEAGNEIIRCAGVAFAITGAWRVEPSRIHELSRARRAIAAAAIYRVLPSADQHPIIPAKAVQSMGTVGSIWSECMQATEHAHQRLFVPEIARRVVRLSEIGRKDTEDTVDNGRATILLGPFRNNSPGSTELEYVEIHQKSS